MLDKELLKKCKKRLVDYSIPTSGDTLFDNTEVLFMDLFNKVLKQTWCDNKLTIFLTGLNISIDSHNDTMVVKDGLNKKVGFKYSHSLLLDYFRQYLFDVELEIVGRDFRYNISITQDNLKLLIKDSKRKKL